MKIRYRRTQIIVIAVLSLLLIGLLQTNLRSFLSDGVRGVTGSSAGTLSNFGRRTASFLSIFHQIGDLKSQNRQLGDKIIALEVDRSKITELEKENNLLKQELGFIEEHKDWGLIPAKIVEREPTSFLDYVVVDRGSRDGITSDMAVISNGILIGQVSEVYESESKIILVTSKDSMVQAMLQNSRAKGILRGGISGLYLENVAQDVDFTPGEYVVTSGLGGKLSQGILIGKARASQSYFSGIYKNIFIEPIADLSKLELVFIVK